MNYVECSHTTPEIASFKIEIKYKTLVMMMRTMRIKNKVFKTTRELIIRKLRRMKIMMKQIKSKKIHKIRKMYFSFDIT